MSTKARGFLLAAVVTLSLAACGSDDAPTAEPSAVEPSPVVSVEPSPSPTPSDTATPMGEPSADTGQVEDAMREFAVEEARAYLRVAPFSRQGLIDQLSSDVAGFPPDIAADAADAVGADWNEQAVRAAEQYTEAEEYTRSELLATLTQFALFTPLEAEHAADAVG